MSSARLKRCPFCNSPAERRHDEPLQRSQRPMCKAKCTNCSATVTAETQEEADRLWNTRPNGNLKIDKDSIVWQHLTEGVKLIQDKLAYLLFALDLNTEPWESKGLCPWTNLTVLYAMEALSDKNGTKKEWLESAIARFSKGPGAVA